MQNIEAAELARRINQVQAAALAHTGTFMTPVRALAALRARSSEGFVTAEVAIATLGYRSSAGEALSGAPPKAPELWCAALGLNGHMVKLRTYT